MTTVAISQKTRTKKGSQPAKAREAIEERNAVVLEYYPMVQRIAHRTAANLGMPTGMEAADLVSHGVLGLVEAWERFDPSRGVAFETYAVPRIKGAIVDAIRQLDWVPRKVRARARRIDEAQTKLTVELGRPPTPEEMEESVGSDMRARRRQPATLIALEDAVSRDSSGGTMAILETLPDVDAEVPGWAIEDAEMRNELLASLNVLPERDRIILTLYYFEGVQLGEIAKLLGVTESRISQIHMRALGTLRGRLADAS